jgi:hypothetical protein
VKVTIAEYPSTINFETKVKLTKRGPGKYALKGEDEFFGKRTEVAQSILRTHKWEAPHVAEDFIVEIVEVKKDGSEVWHLGS